MLLEFRTEMKCTSFFPVRAMSLAALCFGVASITSCQTTHPVSSSTPLTPQLAMRQPVDLERFMGDWYVIGCIPAFIETQAYNAVESYQLDRDGSIATTYRFNKGSFDGPVKVYHPRGFVHDPATRAEWRMQFLWPLKSAYLILKLDDAYQTTVIGVPNRKYAWIMARTKTLPDATYAQLVGFLKSTGHDTSKLRKVPQR
jgi:apolipoprotein D and lipocalin family protein